MCAIQEDGALRQRQEAGDGAQELALAVAVHPGDADDLPFVDIQAQALDLHQAAAIAYLQILEAEHHTAGRLLRLVDLELDRTTDHHLGQVLLTDIRYIDGADVSSPPEDGAAVGHLLDLPQLVGDQEDGLALALQLPQDLHQLVDLLGGQHRRRFIEDDDVGVSEEGLEDLHPLLLADGDLLDQGVGIDGEAVLLAQLGYLGPGALEIEEPPLRRLHAQDDVLGDRVVLHQLEVLVHHADAQCRGDVGVLDEHLLPVEEDLTAVGAVRPEENRHQRRFSRTVFTKQGMNLPWSHLEGHVVVCNDTGEGLGDSPHLDCIFTHLWLLVACSSAVHQG